MNLTYFKADIGNFGDDLNPWLWPQILGPFSEYPENLDFVGIGSIIDERILENPNHKKIIFGSGVRDVNFQIQTKDTIEIQFVRGPISSRILGNTKFITDAAYCLRLLKNTISAKKKYKYAYIPYFRNFNNFDWQAFEKYSGIHVINPTAAVEEVISEINATENLYTSAMHGAILADIYRVPWTRVRFNKTGFESNFTSELKWQDWLRTIDKQDIPTIDFDFNLNQKLTKTQTYIKLYKLIKKIKSVNKFVLSKDEIITELDDKLAHEVQKFIKDYKK